MTKPSIEELKQEFDYLLRDKAVSVEFSQRLALVLVTQIQIAYQLEPEPISGGLLALRVFCDDLVDMLSVSDEFKLVIKSGWHPLIDSVNSL